MGAFSDLIEFLRLNRRAEESAKNSVPTPDATLFFLDDNTHSYTVNKEILEFDNATYRKLQYILSDNHALYIYKWETTPSRKYYVKNADGHYIDIITGAVTYPVENELQVFEVENEYKDYIYDTLLNRVVLLAYSLDEVVVFGDLIDYNPEGDLLESLSSGNYEYSYSNHKTVFANIVNFLGYAIAGVHSSEKRVTVKKSGQFGSMRLIPLIEVNNAYKTYSIKYLFKKNGFQPSFGVSDADCSLQLEFNSVGAFLSFLNETLFDASFDFSASGDDAYRDAFRHSYRQQVLTPLENKVKSNSKLYYVDAMEVLYYLPDAISTEISTDILWMLVEEGIKRNGLTNKLNIAEEDIFIKLLEIILAREGQQTRFMERLTQKIGDDGELLLEYLYDRIHGDNGEMFVQMVNTAWRKSRFVNPDPQINTEFATTDGPLMLPYESEKWLGFYFSNAKATFETTQKKERIVQVAKGTGKYRTVASYSRTGTKEEEIMEYFWYHPFHPVYLKNLEKQDTELKLDTIVPAFLLLANRDKQFWGNVVTAGEYTLDALALASGVGTLAEISAGVIRSFAILRAVGAVAEISGAAASAIIKLANAQDSEQGQAFCEYMFWIEMVSLTGVATASIRKGLRKAARKLVEKEDDLVRLEKKLDDLLIEEEEGVSRKLTKEEKDEIIDDIERNTELNRQNIANGGKSAKFSIIKPKVLKYWTNYLEKKGVKFEIGTEKAIELLKEHNALGLHVREFLDISTNKIKQTIYLYDNPSTSTFLEECYHAIQALEGLPRHMDPITIRGKTYYGVDSWEYLAKKRILNEATRNGISYEEYLFVEAQLQDVLEGTY